MNGGTIALFDLDGTITRREIYIAYLLGFLARHPGRLARGAPLAGVLGLYAAGQRDNRWLKTTFLRTILGGLELSALEAWTEVFLDRLLERGLRPRALEVIEGHRVAGDRILLVTASLSFYAEPLGRRLGFDEVLCTRAAVDGAGRLTGELEGGNCYGAKKLRRVQDYLRDGAPGRPATFYTDHQADLPLLQFVERPIVVSPTRRMRRTATRLGIAIEDWG
jgi:phosphatidylglycerophosphatase C